MTFVGSRCTCQGPWGIGLPFDHPIWQSIVDGCPVHGAARPIVPIDGEAEYQRFVQWWEAGGADTIVRLPEMCTALVDDPDAPGAVVVCRTTGRWHDIHEGVTAVGHAIAWDDEHADAWL